MVHAISFIALSIVFCTFISNQGFNPEAESTAVSSFARSQSREIFTDSDSDPESVFTFDRLRSFHMTFSSKFVSMCNEKTCTY